MKAPMSPKDARAIWVFAIIVVIGVALLGYQYFAG